MTLEPGLPLSQTLGWRLTVHARARAAELGFTVAEVLLAAVDPEVTYRSRRFPDMATHQRGDLAVACWPDTRTVCTVLLRSAERWEHGRDVRSAG